MRITSLIACSVKANTRTNDFRTTIYSVSAPFGCWRTQVREQEIVRFFHCVNNGCKGEQARFLRQLRNRLLDTVHEKQTLLDKVDYLLYTLQQ